MVAASIDALVLSAALMRNDRTAPLLDGVVRPAGITLHATASESIVPIDPADIVMVGFENDGGLNELLAQFGIVGDYKSTLPIHLTDVLQRQQPDVVVARIELLWGTFVQPRRNAR